MTQVVSKLFELSDEQRRTVRAMAGFGVPLKDIAAYLAVDVGVLQQHLGPDLERAVVEANAKVAQALFAMATKQNNVAAAIFWMKARALWRDRPDAGAAQQQDAPKPRFVIRAPPPCASHEEWSERYAPDHAKPSKQARPAGE